MSCWATFRHTSSMCTGMMTCEMALAAVVRCVRSSRMFESMGTRVEIKCVECWARCSGILSVAQPVVWASLCKAQEMNESCHQAILENHRWVIRTLEQPPAEPLPCIFGDVLGAVPASRASCLELLRSWTGSSTYFARPCELSSGVMLTIAFATCIVASTSTAADCPASIIPASSRTVCCWMARPLPFSSFGQCE